VKFTIKEDKNFRRLTLRGVTAEEKSFFKKLMQDKDYNIIGFIGQDGWGDTIEIVQAVKKETNEKEAEKEVTDV
jgi:hypothetical protein